MIQRAMHANVEDKFILVGSTSLGEFGLYDGNGGSTAADVTNGYWSGEVWDNSFVVEGTSRNDRIGNVIRVKSIDVDVRVITQGVNALITNTRLAFILVRAILPTPSSSFNVQQMYLEDQNFAGLSTNSNMNNIYWLTPNSVRNPYFMRNYVVLDRVDLTFDGEYTTAWTGREISVHLSSKMPFNQRFDDSGAFADTAVRLLCVADDGNIGGLVSSAAIVIGAQRIESNSAFYFTRQCHMVFEDA